MVGNPSALRRIAPEKSASIRHLNLRAVRPYTPYSPMSLNECWLVSHLDKARVRLAGEKFPSSFGRMAGHPL
jgi:hypothetical protein